MRSSGANPAAAVLHPAGGPRRLTPSPYAGANRAPNRVEGCQVSRLLPAEPDISVFPEVKHIASHRSITRHGVSGLFHEIGRA